MFTDLGRIHLGQPGLGPYAFGLTSRNIVVVFFATTGKAQKKRGDASGSGTIPRPAKKRVPKCVLNPKFEVRLEMRNAKKGFIVERGIKLDELSWTPILGVVTQRKWETYVSRPPLYKPRIVKEFFAGMIHSEFQARGSVMVRGKEVHARPSDINSYFRTDVVDPKRFQFVSLSKTPLARVTPRMAFSKFHLSVVSLRCFTVLIAHFLDFLGK
ncbi:hypothetical protein Q3G72_010552 [Acer saccharum]|nr:hypothetical protein Q3G72_010552 [Acer saccharum]